MGTDQAMKTKNIKVNSLHDEITKNTNGNSSDDESTKTPVGTVQVMKAQKHLWEQFR